MSEIPGISIAMANIMYDIAPNVWRSLIHYFKIAIDAYCTLHYVL